MRQRGAIVVFAALDCNAGHRVVHARAMIRLENGRSAISLMPARRRYLDVLNQFVRSFTVAAPLFRSLTVAALMR